jgi:hypothetical protein
VKKTLNRESSFDSLWASLEVVLNRTFAEPPASSALKIRYNTSASKKENTMVGNNLTRRDFAAAMAASALTPSVLPIRKPSEPAIAPFHYRAPDAALDDLKRRIAQTRWPDHETVPRWEQGVPSSALCTPVHHWSTKYDWRTCEGGLAQWPQFMTRIDGLDFQFIHVGSPQPNALTMILTRGWPSTVLLFRDVIGPLDTRCCGSENEEI